MVERLSECLTNKVTGSILILLNQAQAKRDDRTETYYVHHGQVLVADSLMSWWYKYSNPDTLCVLCALSGVPQAHGQQAAGWVAIFVSLWPVSHQDRHHEDAVQRGTIAGPGLPTQLPLPPDPMANLHFLWWVCFFFSKIVFPHDWITIIITSVKEISWRKVLGTKVQKDMIYTPNCPGLQLFKCKNHVTVVQMFKLNKQGVTVLQTNFLL